MATETDMTVEYWFNLDYDRLVLSIHSLIKGMKSNPNYLKALNLTIAREERMGLYTLVVAKSGDVHTPRTFFAALQKSLGLNTKKRR